MREVPHVIGINLGKSVFQVHAVDANGRVIPRRRLRSTEGMSFLSSYPSTIVALEACATAHFWARRSAPLGTRSVRLTAPQYARAYVKTNKNDAADAEAEQRNLLHRARYLLIRQRTMLVNALRGHLSEFGVTAGHGIGNVKAY
jgi:transposase